MGQSDNKTPAFASLGPAGAVLGGRKWEINYLVLENYTRGKSEVTRALESSPIAWWMGDWGYKFPDTSLMFLSDDRVFHLEDKEMYFLYLTKSTFCGTYHSDPRSIILIIEENLLSASYT